MLPSIPDPLNMIVFRLRLRHQHAHGITSNLIIQALTAELRPWSHVSCMLVFLWIPTVLSDQLLILHTGAYWTYWTLHRKCRLLRKKKLICNYLCVLPLSWLTCAHIMIHMLLCCFLCSLCVRYSLFSRHEICCFSAFWTNSVQHCLIQYSYFTSLQNIFYYWRPIQHSMTALAAPPFHFL